PNDFLLFHSLTIFNEFFVNLFQEYALLKVEENIGVRLTESLAMWPTAAVSGYYFGNPKSKYFGVGKILEDQLKHYAERKNVDLEFARKWLAPNLVNG
ncbi:vitamin B12 dependent-methionine synthase activation domain-containing protein, partial [Chryseobacterium sp. TY3]